MLGCGITVGKTSNRYNIHLTLTPGSHETRLLRETQHLVAEGIFAKIDVFALWAPGLERQVRLDAKRTLFRMHLISRKLPRILGLQMIKYFEWLIRLVMYCRKSPPDVVTLHSLETMAAGYVLKKIYGARIVYAPHELETESNSLSGFRKTMSQWIESFFIRFADQVIVVNQSILDWYQKRYNLEQLSFVRNIPDIAQTTPPERPVHLKSKIGLNDSSLLFIYQGALTHGRGIEVLLNAFERVAADRHIVFLGYGEMASLIKEAAKNYPNIHYHPAVPPSELSYYTKGADIGISLIEATCLSYYLSLPNKLFEYLYAGLPVIVSDFPEMKRLVDSENLGWCISAEGSGLSQFISKITREDLELKKRNVEGFIAEPLWPREKKVLSSVYGKVVVDLL